MSHPDSAAFREIADKLDAAHEAGIKTPYIYLNFHSVDKEHVRALVKMLALDCPKPKDNDAWGDLGRKKFGNVDVSVYGRYADVCTARTVMREVTVYDCGCADDGTGATMFEPKS